MDPMNAKDQSPLIEQPGSDNTQMWERMNQKSNIGRKKIVKGTGNRLPGKRGIRRK